MLAADSSSGCSTSGRATGDNAVSVGCTARVFWVVCGCSTSGRATGDNAVSVGSSVFGAQSAAQLERFRWSAAAAVAVDVAECTLTVGEHTQRLLCLSSKQTEINSQKLII